MPFELPRIRFGLIVLIDVNNDNKGAAVDNIFVDLVCDSIELLATSTAVAVFLGNVVVVVEIDDDDVDVDVARELLIDDAYTFDGGIKSVGISTSGFVAVDETTNPDDATGRFER